MAPGAADRGRHRPWLAAPAGDLLGTRVRAPLQRCEPADDGGETSSCTRPARAYALARGRAHPRTAAPPRARYRHGDAHQGRAGAYWEGRFPRGALLYLVVQPNLARIRGGRRGLPERHRYHPGGPGKAPPGRVPGDARPRAAQSPG